ncbi:MAG: hydrogenase 2 operon protein HybA [Vicinamibacteria bacterium]|nr:hydrogenase 2 operon protein HybA [Vicinamibacteria bacterium]
MTPSRRTALKVLAGGGVAAAAAAAPVALAREPKVAPPGAMGMLYDTTRCIGCKACVFACQQANDLEPERDAEGLHLAPVDLGARTKNVIKLYKDGARMSYMKAQCLHCVDPACASACMLHSLQKDPKTGVVGYDPSYCVGCRYCQMACPFGVPKFEFAKAVPKIVKCELCRHRVKAEAKQDAAGFTRYASGEGPACCEVCPREAVVYGTRDELIAEAARRIKENPGRYFEDRAYGVKEAGGTQVLYLSHLPFDKLGLPSLPDRGVPHVAYTIQEGLYKGFVAPVVLYGALAAAMWRNRRGSAPPEVQG